MAIEQIERLMTLIKDSDFKYVSIETEAFNLEISKRDVDVVTTQATVPTTVQSTEQLQLTHTNHVEQVQQNVSTDTVATNVTTQTNEREVCHHINSPIVGIVYLAPSPNDKPFVQVGDFVKKGQVICIVEAMKIMNEIKSDVDGYVQSVLVQNEMVVEYNQPIIAIKEA